MANVVLSAKQSRENQVEHFDRAHDFFGDPTKRWDDRLRLEGNSKVKEYLRGRMALVLDCEIHSFSTFDIYGTGRIQNEKRGSAFLSEGSVLLILKANPAYPHKLQHWNQKLVFIPDVQIVQSPDGMIPSLVGLHYVCNEIMNMDADLLLFESTVQGAYKVVPRVTNRKSREFIGFPTALKDGSVVDEIQCAPEIVKNVADNYCAVIERENGSQLKAENICKSITVCLNDERVTVRVDVADQERINVRDVLLGPFNLEP